MGMFMRRRVRSIRNQMGHNKMRDIRCSAKQRRMKRLTLPLSLFLGSLCIPLYCSWWPVHSHYDDDVEDVLSKNSRE